MGCTGAVTAQPWGALNSQLPVLKQGLISGYGPLSPWRGSLPRGARGPFALQQDFLMERHLGGTAHALSYGLVLKG